MPLGIVHLIGVIMVAAGVSACQDTGDPGPARPLPVEVSISDGPTVLVTASATSADAGIVTPAGQSGPLLTLTFRDIDGAAIMPIASERLDVLVENPSTAIWTTSNPAAFNGRISGITAGVTRAVFRFVRSTSTGETVVFTSAVVNVTVTP